jgi:hypothetical protein
VILSAEALKALSVDDLPGRQSLALIEQLRSAEQRASLARSA